MGGIHQVLHTEALPSYTGGIVLNLELTRRCLLQPVNVPYASANGSGLQSLGSFGHGRNFLSMDRQLREGGRIVHKSTEGLRESVSGIGPLFLSHGNEKE